jgi:hypothetical protein
MSAVLAKDRKLKMTKFDVVRIVRENMKMVKRVLV